jgi:cation transport regulator ChaC
MWIFGYGSLMVDGLEVKHGCVERVWADLPGYVRTFNKKSVVNWVHGNAQA